MNCSQNISVSVGSLSDCRQQGDMVFILDNSGSVRQNNFIAMKNLVRDMLPELGMGIGDANVGMLTYGTDATVRIRLFIVSLLLLNVWKYVTVI